MTCTLVKLKDQLGTIEQFFLLFMCCREKAKSHMVHTIVGIFYFRFINRACLGFPDLAFAWVCSVLILYWVLSFLSFWLQLMFFFARKVAAILLLGSTMTLSMGASLPTQGCFPRAAICIHASVSTCPDLYRCPGVTPSQKGLGLKEKPYGSLGHRVWGSWGS